MKKFTTLLFVAFLGISNLIAQTTRYVNPDGQCNGNIPCYTTIQAAVTSAASGDIITINPGTYIENISVSINNLTFVSTAGAASTIIQGVNNSSEFGTFYLLNGGNGTRIGSIGHGFTIIGLNNGLGSGKSLSIAKSAIYLQGSQNNITIEDNIIQAAGSVALSGEYDAINNNILINHNHFTGQTYNMDPNYARQAVVFGGDVSTINTMNFIFTNNQISTITGSGSQGNCLVTLDLVGNNVITGNKFDGTIGAGITFPALRMRGNGIYTVNNNIFNGTYDVAVEYTPSGNNILDAKHNYWGHPKGPNSKDNTCYDIASKSITCTYSTDLSQANTDQQVLQLLRSHISSASDDAAGLSLGNNLTNVNYEPWYNDIYLNQEVFKLIPFNVTGTKLICEGTNTKIILSNSQSGSNYQYQLTSASLDEAMQSQQAVLTLFNKSLNNGSQQQLSTGLKINPSIPGVGDSISFNVSTAGAYTVVATNSITGCTLNMNGIAIITSNMRPTAYITDENNNVITMNLTGTPPWSGTLSDGTPFTGSSNPLTVNMTPGNIHYFTIASLTDANCAAIPTDLTIADIVQSQFDSDGDNVIDSQDAYPNDSTRAFNNYFPATGTSTLAFEDSWPSTGDYDMNDVVVDYQFKNVINSHNQLVETYATFTLRATGANYKSGFGFQLPTNNIPVDELHVTGSNIHENYLMINANGTEQNQNKPTIIVFDNAFDVLHYPGSGIGINTTQGIPYVTPVTITLHITYTPYTYTEQQLDIDHFNPFIIINKDRTKEVHLPDYAPTALANTALFGTSSDNSIPSQNRYYKTTNNLPWALNIYNSFSYPTEKTEITKAYLHFIDWVLSNGTNYTDWYTNTATGYRDNSKIFVPATKK